MRSRLYEIGDSLRRFFCVVLTVLIPVPSSFAQTTPRATMTGSLDIRALSFCSPAISKESPVLLVRFTSDQLEGVRVIDGKRMKATIPATVLLNQPESEAIAIQGNFALEKALHLQYTLGKVKKTVDVDTRWMGNPAYHRLKALLPKSPESAEKVSILLLTIIPPKAKDLSEAYFMGPLQADETARVAEYVETLVKEPFDRMSKASARALLKSSNTWKVWLGLAKLHENEALTFDDLVQAGSTLPSAEAPKIVRQMLDRAIGDKAAKPDLTPALIQLFFKTTPEHSYSSVSTLNQLLKNDLYGARRNVDLPKLQEAAVKYRAKVASEEKQRMLVSELDRLISLNFN